jgi:hypothetical protein
MNIKDTLRKLDDFCKKSGWNGRNLAHGTNYRSSKLNTIISVYSSGTDKPGTIEVAFEVTNIAKLSKETIHRVNEWIKELQTSVGAYAKPKTNQKYPRVAISNNQHADQFIDSANSFINKIVLEEAAVKPFQDGKEYKNNSIEQRIISSILSRRGQPKFRQSLLSTFNETCCISRNKTVEVLEAAHITPHTEETNYSITNGLLLRADIHTLYDLNLLGIDENGLVHISPALRDSEYFQYAGVNIEEEIPKSMADNLRHRFELFKRNKA